MCAQACVHMRVSVGSVCVNAGVLRLEVWATWWRCWSWVQLLYEGSKSSWLLSQLCSPPLFDLVLWQFLLFLAGCWMQVASNLIVHCTSCLVVAVPGWDHRHKPCLFYRWLRGWNRVVWLHQLSHLTGLQLALIKLTVPVCRESREQAFCNGWIQGRSFYSLQGKTDFVILWISQLYFMELWDKLRITGISKYYFLSFLFPILIFVISCHFSLVLKPYAKNHCYSQLKRAGTFYSSVWWVCVACGSFCLGSVEQVAPGRV